MASLKHGGVLARQALRPSIRRNYASSTSFAGHRHFRSSRNVHNDDKIRQADGSDRVDQVRPRQEQEGSSPEALAGPTPVKPEPDAKERAAKSSEASAVQDQVSVYERLRQLLHSKRNDLEPRLKEHLARLGKQWNEYSGYEEVVAAKKQVHIAESKLKQLREQQTAMRHDYMTAVSRRAASQRTLNELLVRKSTWSEADLATYTDLLKAEHGDARNEREATERYETIGKQVNAAWDNVVRTTLERYHLEQVWSDRVRAGSTYGSLVVAGINVVVFALALLIFEPYKRRKLARTFEARLLQGEEQNTAMLAAVVDKFESRVEEMQSQNGEIGAALDLLLRQAGLSRRAILEHVVRTKDGKDDFKEADILTESVGPKPAPAAPPTQAPRQQTVSQRRREMGMAAAVGFAVGAGLLAAFGALHS